MPDHTNDQPTPHDTPIAHDHHDHHGHHHPYMHSSAQGRMMGGVLLIFIGTLFLIQQIFDVNVWRYSWPLIIIALGLFTIMKRR